MNYKKGDIIDIKISSLSSEGKGIARTEEGYVIFTDDALPGDFAKVQLYKKKSRFALARVMDFIEKSPDRVEPRCIHFGVCGGCRLQNYAYDKQLEFKTQVAKDAFEKIGGFENVNIPLALGCENEYFYRNKMEFSFSDEKWLTTIDKDQPREKFAFGLHIPGFHTKILDITECHLQTELTPQIVNFTRDFFKKKNTSIYSVKTSSGYLRFLIIRQCKNTQDFMLNLITFDYDKELMNEYAEGIKKLFPQVTTLLNSVSKSKAQVAFAEDINVIYGSGDITEKLFSERELIFRISPNAFFQTNTLQAQKLYETAAEFGEFTKNDKVLDLYCGTGSISLFIADKVNEVKGIELIKESIESAKMNAEVNGIRNTQFEVSDIKDFLGNTNAAAGFNKVILDPPRSGLHPDICERLSDMDFEKIVYVSCNPSTQARDLKIIMSKGRYEIGRVQPVDMFPQTYHIENVVELNFKSS